MKLDNIFFYFVTKKTKIQEKKRKQAETDRKRAEVRARLEEASKAKKAKKGFMTPDRKKKLRVRISYFFHPQT